MRLAIGTRTGGSPRVEPWPTPPFETTLRVIPASDGWVNADAFEALCAGVYVVASTASRMAYPLDGPAVPLVVPMRPSSGTVHGAIQVLPSGKPVLLMAECQTTGGYPVVGVVYGADLTHAAQVAPGESIRFVAGTRAEAVIADWNAAVGTQAAPRDAQIIELQEAVSTLKQTIVTLRQRNTELERKNQAAVTLTAELHTQLRAVRGDEPQGTVTPLPNRQARRRW